MPEPLLPVNVLDYTGLTRLGLEDRLQTLFRQVNPDWDDYSSNHPENLLLHGEALLSAVVAGVQDERVRQLAWATVTDRLAAIRLGQHENFTLRDRTAGTVQGYFSLPNAALAAKKVLIPAGTRIASGNIVHTTLYDMDIEISSNTSNTLAVENTESQTDTFQATESANEVLKLALTPVVGGSISVTAGNGDYVADDPDTSQAWQSFTSMGPDTRGFIVRIDHNGAAYVLFGNSVCGAVPTGAIEVTYKTGGGSSNSVSAGARWNILDAIYDTDGAQVTVLFTNTTATEDGFDEMSVDEARVLGPLASRTRTRAVNEPDFEFIARSQLAAVARAAMFTSNQDSSIQEDYAELHIVAFGSAYSSGYYAPATPSSELLSQVEALYEKSGGPFPALMGIRLFYEAAIFYYINVAVRIFKSANYTGAQVKTNITSELQKFFAVADENKVPTTTIDWGFRLLGSDGYPDYKIAWSHVFNAINDTPGVREISPTSNNLLLNNLHSSIVLNPMYFPVLGDIQVFDMDQGGVEL